jgi:23S rRNA (pseudouridine1915-N3)-methyltransferase
MKKIKIVAIDRTRKPFLKTGVSFYLDRLTKYIKTEMVEVKSSKIGKGTPAENVLSQEGEALLNRLRPGDYVISLDRSGKRVNSERFAKKIGQLLETTDSLVFLVGGTLGLSGKILNMSNEIISLSNLTFTHEMSRLILLEQVYRAFTILRGEKYHK